ncbi:MAG: DUF104 domain-containing protein [Planctomycetaceae bacterium]|nr:DUF104 domain-containing protein [Planctomycetaceae bacterium]
MNAIPAVYEKGLFRPLDPVDLPEGTKVIIETEDVAAERVRAAHRRIFETLSHRYDDGEPGDSENHNEHEP